MIKCGSAARVSLLKLARDTVPERAAINLKRQGIGQGGEPNGVTPSALRRSPLRTTRIFISLQNWPV
jgi:hypothetical protein